MRKLLGLFVLCAVALATPSAQQRSIDDFFRTISDDWVRLNPNLAVATRYFSGAEQDRLEQQLTSSTPAAVAQRRAFITRGLSELAAFDRRAMTDVQRVSAELLKLQLEAYLEWDKYDDFAFPLDQFNGANVGLVSVITVTHPLRTPKDASNYVVRLGQVGQRMAETIVEAKRLASKDLIPPRFILDATIRQMRMFIEQPAASNPFVSTLNERAAAIDELPAAERAALVARAEQIVTKDVYPRWREAIALLESLLPRSSDHAGLWRFEGGAEAYEAFVKLYTTTNLKPDEIHAIGLHEVARIEKEMDAIFRSLGRTEGSVNARWEKLLADRAYPQTEDGRKQVMADIDVMIRDAEKRAALLFDRRPKSPVIAQPYPAFRQAGSAPSYMTPPLDGSRPGIFQMTLRSDYMSKPRLRTLVYHETVPGHHFQLALTVENSALPRFRQVRLFGGAGATTEGWGLYAEQLAAENGWYDGDPEGMLGYLQAQLFRARRLVVDTGIHAKRWTRQQVIDYGITVSETERYVVAPGQACSYMIGRLRILELRDKAKAALRGKYSDRAFHNAVLDPGIVPLDLLEEEVERYIVRTR
ncbi:MAG TPA: DUF885 domain-containing protein [Vicinamibacterales bacterium]|nr:DUF885 domain-containing protein [Vicinamibacterales bacterium]